jgi:hypothetical protein
MEREGEREGGGREREGGRKNRERVTLSCGEIKFLSTSKRPETTAVINADTKI